jgi:hypothetical protein
MPIILLLRGLKSFAGAGCARGMPAPVTIRSGNNLSARFGGRVVLRVKRRVEASEAEENDAESESSCGGFANCVYVGHFKSPWLEWEVIFSPVGPSGGNMNSFAGTVPI